MITKKNKNEITMRNKNCGQGLHDSKKKACLQVNTVWQFASFRVFY